MKATHLPSLEISAAGDLIRKESGEIELADLVRAVPSCLDFSTLDRIAGPDFSGAFGRVTGCSLVAAPPNNDRNHYGAVASKETVCPHGILTIWPILNTSAASVGPRWREGLRHPLERLPEIMEVSHVTPVECIAPSEGV